jgi:hypothetical protein
MPTIDQIKERETTSAPLFIFECTLPTGVVERWCMHGVMVAGHAYDARVLEHNAFQLRTGSDDGLDAPQRILLTLANADSRFSQIERETGFKGSQLTVKFLFYDLASDAPESEVRTIFRGVANPAEEIREDAIRLNFSSRLNLQRIVLPEVRIERRCPWRFPANADQRQEALTGGDRGKYSALFKCGYSPDQAGGVGTLNGSVPFTSCDYTRASCSARGMFDTDAGSHQTRRFGGIEFVPAQIDVRSAGEKGTHLSPILDNEARYNGFVPLVYGTAWYKPPVVFARNDGNLTRAEVLLGMGQIDSVVKVVVNGVEIPEGQDGKDMTATGWFNVVSTGTRNGGFNLNFTDGAGHPLGDPYGNMAYLSVVVPNQVSGAQSLPKIEVFIRGLRLEHFDTSGASLGEAFTNNPVWVMLDVLRRSGWRLSELDLSKFAATASYCEELIATTDLYGTATSIPRFQCNLVLQSRRSAADVVKGIRNGSGLILTYGADGLLGLTPETSLRIQLPTKPAGSNSVSALNGGWPVYEFSDGSAAYSSILRKRSGEPSLRLWSRTGADTPNRLTIEFQDEFNEYQQDSLALVDVDDSVLTAREVSAGFNALGIPNFDQATRVLRLQLNKAIRGYTFVEFQTTVRGIGLKPGDLIAVTYLKEGLDRQPFRVVAIAPGENHETVNITAQWHEDSWYTDDGSGALGGRRKGSAEIGLPRPLAGSVIDTNGREQFGMTETAIQSADGSFAIALDVAFTAPTNPALSGAAIPLISFNPTIVSTGGTLQGNQTIYYAVSAVDATGGETDLSFVVRAKIPAGTNTNSVTLTGLVFSPGTASFRVYRGESPSQMLRIATGVTVAASFSDSGASASLVRPPDSSFDHANFYWRWEQLPEVNASIFSSSTIGNTGLGLLANDFVGSTVRITRGKGAAQERRVISNTGTTITVAPAWNSVPDSTSYFTVADSTWNLGAVATVSPVTLTVPNRSGSTLQVSGRSANVRDQESPYELNPLSRWQIGGAGEGGTDSDFPPRPSFALNPAGQGTVELLGISFTSLANTRTISAGTLTTFYWDELSSPTPTSLVVGISATATTLNVVPSLTVDIGDRLQIGSEIVGVLAISGGGSVITVERGVNGSSASTHPAAAPVYPLQRAVTIVPFVKGFFGSPSSGSYVYPIYQPDVRIAAAEFFVTNSFGNSPVKQIAFCATAEQGLRTLSGGQITLQVEGYLATQNDAAPPFVMEGTHSVKELFANLREAPSGGPVSLRVRRDSVTYCTLTIPDGETVSNTVDGFGLAPLPMDAQVSLDIVSVPGAANTLSGRDLTVAIRL